MRWILLPFWFLLSVSGHAQTVMDTTMVIDFQSILFESGKWDLDGNDSTILKGLVESYGSLTNSWIEIKGHTDSDGNQEYNMNLSLNRCHEVNNFLVSQGIDSSDIKLMPLGENHPVESNITSTGKQKNRRVEIKVFKPIKIWKIIGKVRSVDDSIFLDNAMVLLHSKFFYDTTFTDANGRFEILSPYRQVIGMDVLAKDHLFKTTMLQSDEKTTAELVIDIKEATPGRSMDLNEFFFVGDRAIILEEFVPELENLETFLNISPDICIEIVGHVNEPGRPPVDSSSFEYNLSVARSKLIYDRMLTKGIDKKRMIYSGKGNWQMLFPLAKTSEEMRKNRRVEILIRDCNETKKGENDPLDERFDFYSLPLRN